MDRDEYLTTLRRDIAALLVAVRDAGPGAPVPDCPGWTAGDLAWHVADVWSWWATIVADRATAPGDGPPLERPDSFDEVVAVAEDWGRRLDDVLTATDPATPHWTWGSDKTTAFVVRRMAQETAVHRLDAERTAGRAYVIEPTLAADGVDEFLFEFLMWKHDTAAAVAGSVHLHCTDVAGEWLVDVGADDGAAGPVVSRQHAKGDAAIRGPANDLLLVLWRRLPLDAVEVIGDRGVAERFVARTNLSG
jgi:uncharacterized protein (TIGR03083 family)